MGRDAGVLEQCLVDVARVGHDLGRAGRESLDDPAQQLRVEAGLVLDPDEMIRRGQSGAVQSSTGVSSQEMYRAAA